MLFGLYLVPLEVMKEVIKDWTTTLSKTLFIRAKAFQKNCFKAVKANSMPVCITVAAHFLSGEHSIFL